MTARSKHLAMPVACVAHWGPLRATASQAVARSHLHLRREILLVTDTHSAVVAARRRRRRAPRSRRRERTVRVAPVDAQVGDCGGQASCHGSHAQLACRSVLQVVGHLRMRPRLLALHARCDNRAKTAAALQPRMSKAATFAEPRGAPDTPSKRGTGAPSPRGRCARSRRLRRTESAPSREGR